MKKLFISIIILIYSCKTVNIVGKYSDDEKHNWLTIRSDSTFLFNHYFDQFFAVSKGTWTQDNKSKILLFSNPPKSDIPINVTSQKNSKGVNYMNINLNYPEKKAFSEYFLFVNDTLYQKLKFDGLNNIAIKTPIYSFYIRVIWSLNYWMNGSNRVPNETYWNTEKYIPTRQIENQTIDIRINITNEIIYLSPFNYTIVKIKGKQLKFVSDNNIGKLWKINEMQPTQK